MDPTSILAEELPAVLQIGDAERVDDYLVRALWKAEVPGLTPAVVSCWAALLRARGTEFSSHASACHYWLFERLSGGTGLPVGHPDKC